MECSLVSFCAGEGVYFLIILHGFSRVKWNGRTGRARGKVVPQGRITPSCEFIRFAHVCNRLVHQTEFVGTPMLKAAAGGD